MYSFGEPVVKSPSHAKLVWNCRRGMLELDLMLQQCIKTQFSNFDAHQLVLFERLLDNSDPDLFAYLLGHDMPDDEELKDFVAYIRTQYTF
jgi:antitoxin CptB